MNPWSKRSSCSWRWSGYSIYRAASAIGSALRLGRFQAGDSKQVTRITSYGNPIQYGIALFVWSFMHVFFGAVFVGAGYSLIRAAYSLVRP